MRHPRIWWCAAVVALLAAGCADDSDTDVGPTGSTTSSTIGPPSTDAPTPTDPPASTSTSLAGEPFELTPEAGRVLTVVGVAFDDMLNVRQGPGVDEPVVATLAPIDDMSATGRARLLPASIWWEVEVADGNIGWINARFSAQRGPTDDVTAAVEGALSEIPMAESMAELGELVAGTVVNDPDVPTDVVMVTEPTVGDLGEVVFDVVGLGDDAVHAVRLHVFGTPGESGAGFSLMSVESTDMCDALRGVSEPSGLCA